MEMMNPYLSIIALCFVLVLSYYFNLLAKHTNIPSVLLLITLGIGIKQGLEFLHIDTGEYLFIILEVIGIVGLIMIVLEAALELELKKEKVPLIVKSLFIALSSLIATSFLTAYILYNFVVHDFFNAMIYAVPLSIMSSAIVIPSVAQLVKSKKEFLVYESAFSDIFGIMLFFFMLNHAETSGVGEIVLDVSLNIFLTIVLAVIISYVLVWLLHRINAEVKLFLLIAILVMLYSAAKMFHFSSLLIIIIFGLVLNNYKTFFVGKLRLLIQEEKLLHVLKDFHMITKESAFFVRTFFFVIFGMTLQLTDLLDVQAAFISAGIVAGILVIRFIFLKLFGVKYFLPELFVAPRGLITILLFFSIPAVYISTNFSTGILLYTILISSIVMAVALILKGKEGERVERLEFNNWAELDEEINQLSKKN